MRMRWGGIAAGVVVVVCAAGAHAADFSAHGYFRTRSHALFDLDTQRPSTANNDRFGLIQYNQLRLRVEPAAKLNDFLSLHSQFDLLDNLRFGSAQTQQLATTDPIVGTFTLPAGAGSLSTVGGAAGENGSLNVRRVWMDALTPIGKFRVGRQPSHWGLGLVNNDGNGADADFGDSVDGVTYVVQVPLQGDSALSIGALWDIAFEAQNDPRVNGLAGAIRDNGQDTNQWGLFFLYEQDLFEVGALGVFRKRDGSGGTATTATDITGVSRAAGIDGNTRVFIGDGYAKYKQEEWSVAAEYAFLGGKISTGVALNAIPFQGLAAPGIIELPANQSLRVHLAALEAAGDHSFGGEWRVQTGFAEGDGSPLSQRITQYGFRQDYQIGFLMFHYPLGTSPRMRDGTTGAQLAGGVPITGNYINNALYGSVMYLHNIDIRHLVRQANEFKVGARVVSALAHKDPVNLDFSALLNNANMPVITSRGKWYGAEADLVVEGRFFDHLRTNLEMGILLPGGAYDINTSLVAPGGIVATIPTDAANLAYGGRLVVSMEF